MINVPDRVKDALRSGDFKKNYKISVGDWVEQWVYVIRGFRNYTIEYEGLYDVFALHVNHVIFTIQKPYEEAVTRTFYSRYSDPTGKAGFIDSLPAGTIITLVETNPAGWFMEVKIFTQAFVEDFTLENNSLISESVKIDERMCSDPELKFGLCEGTSVEFQYFGEHPNINERALQIYIEVQYKDADNSLKWYPIPIGFFTVKECSRQASTGIRKVTAYNKLMSDYLNQDCTAKITEMIQDSSSGLVSLADVLASLMSDYSIDVTSYEKVGGGYIYNPVINYTTNGVRIYETDGTEYEVPYPLNPYLEPVGTYFGIFTMDFYLIPEGETGIQTSDTYYYVIDYSVLWAALQEKLNVAWQHIPGSLMDTSIVNLWAVKEDNDYLSISDSIYAGHVTIQNGELPTVYIRDHKNEAVRTALFTGYYPKVTVAVLVESDLNSSGEHIAPPGNDRRRIEEYANSILQELNGAQLATIYKYHGTAINSVNIGLDNLKNSVSLRDLQSAAFEVDCQYGKLDRVTDIFAGIDLNHGALYPRDNLYPADGLYPQGSVDAGYPSMYSKLWADEGNVRSFRYLIITYKTTETIEGQTQEVEKTLQRTVNADGTDDYNMSDNWLFKNLTWTASQVGTYADAMVAKMQNIRWFPFEMWCAGLPYIEAGDALEITIGSETYLTYVLRRVLSGIQNLQDEMINGTLDIF